jgi:hypothetical protein
MFFCLFQLLVQSVCDFLPQELRLLGLEAADLPPSNATLNNIPSLIRLHVESVITRKYYYSLLQCRSTILSSSYPDSIDETFEFAAMNIRGTR